MCGGTTPIVKTKFMYGARFEGGGERNVFNTIAIYRVRTHTMYW